VIKYISLGGINHRRKVLESIRSIINFVNDLLWNKNILVVMLIGTAVYLTFKTKFMQFRLFGDIVRILGE
jgi:AGCS family alanine or glycine:cation symporter